MATETGLSSYANATKESWRGWLWNRIVERLPEFHRGHVPPIGSGRLRNVASQKTVLYLAGPEDNDRSFAIKRGFAHENLIALDRSGAVVSKVRQRGVIAINGDLCEAIGQWPESWPLDVIIADFCCGFNATAFALVSALIRGRAVTGQTVIAVNFLRGRDAESNELRATFAGEKHRGNLFITSLIAGAAFGGSSHVSDSGKFSLIQNGMDFANPVISSYPSTAGTQWFDSVVFRFPLGRTAATPHAEPSPVRPKITAARAVRTAKIRRAAS